MPLTNEDKDITYNVYRTTNEIRDLMQEFDNLAYDFIDAFVDFEADGKVEGFYKLKGKIKDLFKDLNKQIESLRNETEYFVKRGTACINTKS